MSTVRALPVAGQAAGISLYPDITHHGESMMVHDRRGDGWLGTVRVSINGQRNDGIAYLTLTASQARDLAGKLARQADFAEARAKGNAGPCLCTAWSHNLYPCPNDAAMDYHACRECWTPETGQSTLDMGHGARERTEA